MRIRIFSVLSALEGVSPVCRRLQSALLACSHSRREQQFPRLQKLRLDSNSIHRRTGDSESELELSSIKRRMSFQKKYEILYLACQGVSIGRIMKIKLLSYSYMKMSG